MARRDGFDGFRYAVSVRGERRSPRALPALTRGALALARRAAPRLLVLVTASQLLAALLLAAQVVFSKLVIEAMLEESAPGGSVEPVIAPLAGLAVAGALTTLLAGATTHLQRLLAEKVQHLSMGQILEVTTRVHLLDFERADFFDDLQRVKVNALTRPLTMINGLVQGIGGVAAICGLGVAVALTAPAVLPLLLVGGIPMAWLSRRSGQAEYRFVVRTTNERRRRAYLESLLSDRQEAKEVRAFGLGDTLRRRWEAGYARYLAELDRHVRHRVVLASWSAAASALTTGAALALLAWLIVEDRISLAAAGAAVIAVRLLASRIQQLFGGIGGLFESSLYLRDMQAFLERAPARDDREHRADPGDLRELCAEDVWFRYPDADGEALQGVDIEIGSNEVVALVGENGSGKTTLAKLLAQMFEPTGGRMLWNGRDVASLDADGIRSRVGVIFQDFVQYQLAARDNIEFGRPEAAGERGRAESAATRAGADRVIDRLPDGYDTVLGQEFYGGQELSGGQWQRVALARAFFRDAQLLVLDEPTAAVDARSEAEIFQHVRDLARGRSVLLISHRFSTVRSADRIYVLDGGKVIEHGSHAELMALEGRYAEMFRLQATAYL